MTKSSNTYWTVSICLALALATLATFWQVRGHEFITTFDDDLYIVDNDHVKAGLTFKGVVWAFTTAHAFNWHPLTWISHMLDCRFFDVNPAGHLFTNVLIHIANTLLLFLVLKRATTNLWASAFIAAAFALHPLHVESVAWASERKDVLSTFFGILAIWAYLRYTEHPNIQRYLLTALLFCLSLLSKQMLVTLPIVLLLLDYWPLGRLKLAQQSSRNPPKTVPSVSIRRCLLEKVPLLLLSVAASLVVYLVQLRTGTVRSYLEFPLSCRITNALVAYVAYIGKMFWPAHLAIFYPHQEANLPLWQIIGSGLLLLLITAAAIYKARQKPYLLVGWLWYLVTALPVIGIVQVGVQAYADRYTYVPLTGLFIIIAWGANDLFSRLCHRQAVLALVAVAVIAALGVMQHRQVKYWRDGMTLYTHATQVTKNNWWAYHHIGELFFREEKFDEAIKYLNDALRIKPDFADAHNNIGAALVRQEKFDEAIQHLTEALQINPASAEAHANLGFAFAKMGDDKQAIEHYLASLQIDPAQPETQFNLANSFMKKGELDRAVLHYQQALNLKSDYLEARSNLAKALANQGKLQQAIEHWQQLLQTNPNEPVVHNNLATAYYRLGDFDKAISHWQNALRLNPDNVSVLGKLAWLLATCNNPKYRNPNRAVELAENACKLTSYNNPGLLDILAAAYAASGKFDDAVKTAQKALAIATVTAQKDLASNIIHRLNLYRQGHAYYE
jgi:tetratricopeptide (TPR) repeat protein